jgi:hypothetical protein
MPTQHIDLSAEVESEKQRRLAAARDAFDNTVAWLTETELSDQLHRVEAGLLKRLMHLGVLLLNVWVVHRLPAQVAETLRHRRGWYLFAGLVVEPVRSRFGVGYVCRPEYVLVHGEGPMKLAPFDREIGLAAGRMSLGVHLIVALLVAKMPFESSHDVMGAFGGYVPATRSMHGIVDGLGPQAAQYMEDLPAPDDDGEILVLECDHKGAPHMGPEEHRLRQKKHKKRPRGLSERERRRAKRSRKRRERKKKGDKSKNARMATIGVVYTLCRQPDGSVEGPINRRVFGTFKGARRLFETLKREAVKRGYGERETIFLADGEKQLWKLQKEFFPKATPCLDWYHLSEYLWTAGGSVHRSKSKSKAARKAAAKALKLWVNARQDELRADNVDEVLATLRELRTQVALSGPGTKTRRENVDKAITYIENHRAFMPYQTLSERGLVIGTGNIEGAAKHIGARLDGSGMRWSSERSEHVLALRCVLASDEWDGFAEAVARAHEQREDWTVERVTPNRPMTPHKAARKAA